MSALQIVRDRPFEESSNGAQPAYVHVRTPAGTVKVGVSREDAVEFLGSSLFDGAAIVIFSLSGWSEERMKRNLELAEALAVLHQLLGPAVLPMLRAITLGGGATYFAGLTAGRAFLRPTPLQDASLSRALDARVITASR